MIKKVLALIMASVLMTGCFTACSQGGPGGDSGMQTAGAGDPDKLQIVTTIFPVYDWVRNVLGDQADHAEITLLMDNGVDLHSYQPTAVDIMKISTCDLFVYVGGQSDRWVDDTLLGAAGKDIDSMNLLELLGDAAREEEIVEGMQGEDHEHGRKDGGDDSDHHDDGVEYDEHVWLSLRSAALLVDSIAGELKAIDPEHADAYAANAKAYIKKINALDEAYQAAVSQAPVKTLLFGDRFPFRYLTDDYDLDYYAAFAGCSAESEASFETVAFLAQKVDELSLHAVMTIEGSDHRIAETIIKSTGSKDQKILTLNSLQAVTLEDAADGMTYLSVMEDNLEVLKEALQ